MHALTHSPSLFALPTFTLPQPPNPFTRMFHPPNPFVCMWSPSLFTMPSTHSCPPTCLCSPHPFAPSPPATHPVHSITPYPSPHVSPTPFLPHPTLTASHLCEHEQKHSKHSWSYLHTSPTPARALVFAFSLLLSLTPTWPQPTPIHEQIRTRT